MKIIFNIWFISILFLSSCNSDNNVKVYDGKKKSNTDTTQTKNDDKKLKKVKLSDNVVLSKNAKCRMDCRKVELAEIEEILKNGNLNPKKSEPDHKPCPIYAIEGVSKKDKQEIRVLIEACKNETTIITVVDVGNKKTNCKCK